MDSGEAAVEAFVDRYSSDQFDWYKAEAAAFDRRLAWWTWLSFIFGFLATIAAAFPSERLLSACPDARELLRWTVVVLSAAATLSAGTLVPRYRGLFKAREAGRVQTALVANLARIELLTSTDEAQRAKIKSRFIRDLMAIEGAYGTITSPDSRPDDGGGGGHPTGAGGGTTGTVGGGPGSPTRPSSGPAGVGTTDVERQQPPS